jgi:hypothetical protein
LDFCPPPQGERAFLAALIKSADTTLFPKVIKLSRWTAKVSGDLLSLLDSKYAPAQLLAISRLADVKSG